MLVFHWSRLTLFFMDYGLHPCNACSALKTTYTHAFLVSGNHFVDFIYSRVCQSITSSGFIAGQGDILYSQKQEAIDSFLSQEHYSVVNANCLSKFVLRLMILFLCANNCYVPYIYIKQLQYIPSLVNIFRIPLNFHAFYSSFVLSFFLFFLPSRNLSRETTVHKFYTIFLISQMT